MHPLMIGLGDALALNQDLFEPVMVKKSEYGNVFFFKMGGCKQWLRKVSQLFETRTVFAKFSVDVWPIPVQGSSLRWGMHAIQELKGREWSILKVCPELHLPLSLALNCSLF